MLAKLYLLACPNLADADGRAHVPYSTVPVFVFDLLIENHKTGYSAVYIIFPGFKQVLMFVKC